MRLVIQRVSQASVEVDQEVVGSIDSGLLVLIGIESEDTKEDVDWLLEKTLKMRIFPDEEGNMNLSLLDIEGGLLSVSQFTLHAKTKKGNRPSFIRSAHPSYAEELYDYWCEKASERIEKSATGVFGAHMNISLVNDGPVTITMDSKNRE